MKNISVIVLVISIIFTLFPGNKAVFAQEPEQPDIFEQAEAEADRLQRVLDLEDWQVFYVDSILKHDFSAMMADYEKLRGSKVTNSSLYISVQDKWMEQIDKSYRKIFNDEQWAAYLKTGAGKAQKARDKRKAKSVR